MNTPRIRTSERRSFKTCPQQWKWSYRQGLVFRRSRPDARWFGTGVHLALAERYKYPGLRRGRDVLKVWRDYVGDETAYARQNAKDEGPPDEEWAKAGALGEAMLGGYLDRYGMDERWHVVSTEQRFEVRIPHPTSGEIGWIYNGTFDGVRRDLENADQLWLWENKTAAQIKTGHLWGDDQAGSYWAIAPEWLAGQGIKFSGKFEGIMYDFLRKAKPTAEDKLDADGVKRNKPTKAHYIAALNLPEDYKMTLAGLEIAAANAHVVVLGDVSKVQPTPLFLREEVWRTRPERRKQIEHIQNEGLAMDAMRTGTLPIYKNHGDQCGYCDFRDMCQLHEQGSDWKQFRDAMFTVRDPYADHRYDTGE